jgi:HB1/ASXL restriction endonuclease-like protein with HTH domain
MRNIFEVLHQKELQLRQLQQEVDTLRAAARLLADEVDEQPQPKSSGDLSQSEMIKAVLKENGHPMHVKDISKAIQDKFGKELKPSYVAPVIHRMLGKWFVKANQPNTFGLTEWPLEIRSLTETKSGIAITTKTFQKAAGYEVAR